MNLETLILKVEDVKSMIIEIVSIYNNFNESSEDLKVETTLVDFEKRIFQEFICVKTVYGIIYHFPSKLLHDIEIDYFYTQFKERYEKYISENRIEEQNIMERQLKLQYEYLKKRFETQQR